MASIPGVALAQEAGGNSACDEFCHENFSGRAAGTCTSAGARGRGPCYECTPGIGPGPHFTPECEPNEEFNPETCTCEAVGCSGSTEVCADLFTCGANNECACYNTTEGSHACVVNFQFCDDLTQTCQSSNDCPAGTACVVTCCPDNLCAPLCGTTTSAALQAESGGGNSARKPTL